MSTGADWVEQARKLVDTFLAPAEPAADGGMSPDGCPDPAAHGAACRWCPVCQVVAVARGERPDVSAALADVLTATATALRTFAAAAEAPTAPAAEDDVQVEDPPPVAQQIEIA